MSGLVDVRGEPLTSMPVAADPAVESEVSSITADFFEQVRSNPELMKSISSGEGDAPKAWYADPYNLLDSVGMGYRATPSYLTYDTLRIMSERDSIIGAILLTRINQVASFARAQENKYSVGFTIRLRGRRDRTRRLTDSERERSHELEMFVLNCGRDYNPGRDTFETFIRKFVRDRLTYDQACFEKVRAYDRKPHSFFALPSDTFRVANPTSEKGTPDDVQAIKNNIKYVQLLNAQIVAEFTHEELAFCVQNPRTSIKTYGYGLPETEMLMTTVTSHMWAEEWNRRAFSQGSTIKGVLNLKGNIPPSQFEAFKRQWTAQVSGIGNAWKTPVTNTEGAEWLPLQMSNTEMGYQMWMEYLIKIATAIFQMDPAEINFDIRGGVGQQPVFMSTNEGQQKESKDRGLRPLLRFIEDNINKHLIWDIDPRFEFAFVGLDAKTEDQAVQLRMQQVQNTHTLNEVRELEDLPPVENGDIVLNATFTGYVSQKEAMDAQAAMMGGGAGGPPGAEGGAPPGGPPGAEGGAGPEEDGPTPMGMLGAQKPGEEEQQGADNLKDAAQGDIAPKPGEKEKEKKESKEDEDDNRYYLHVNDWESSVHASLKGDGDLQKSLYDTLEID